MKVIFLILLFSTMLFSTDRQIIVGSFSQEKYAQKHMEELNNYIANDNRLKKQLKKYAIRTVLKKIGSYYVIALLPTSSYKQLYRILYLIESYYDDAYVLELPSSKKIAIEIPVEPMPVMAEIEEVKKERVEKNIEIIKAPKKKIKAQEPIKQKYTQDNYDIELILALLILILIGIGYVIYKRNLFHILKS